MKKLSSATKSRIGLALLVLVLLIGAGFAPNLAHALSGGITIGGGGVTLPSCFVSGELGTPNNCDSNITITPGSQSNPVTVQGQYQLNVQVPTDLWYAFNRALGTSPSSDTEMLGYVDGLSQPNVTIGYDLSVLEVNGASTTPVAPSSNIPEGQTLELVFAPLVDQNIGWFGTGYSMDSPYGNWDPGVVAPARVNDSEGIDQVSCDLNDFLNYTTLSIGGLSAGYGVYIPFEVSPPTRTVSNLSGLSCNQGVTQSNSATSSIIYTCTASNIPQTINPSFNFSNTYGEFYYRYSDPGYWPGDSAGCYGNNIPMTGVYGTPTANGNSTSTSALPGGDLIPGAVILGSTTTPSTDIQPAYKVIIPSDSIPYPLTIVAPTGAPTPPVITGPKTGTVGTAYTYSFTGADSSGDPIRYGVDWTDIGTAQTYLPSFTGSVVSSTTQSYLYPGWGTAGTYTFEAFTEDASTSEKSAWASYTVVITAPEPDLTASDVTPSTAIAGAATTLGATISNSNSTTTSEAFPDLFQVATSVAGESNPAWKATFSNPKLAASKTTHATTVYTFASAGTYYVRACANENISGTNIVDESNYGNNCSPTWTKVTVSSSPSSASVSCSVSSGNPPIGTPVTYTATASGTVTTPYTWTGSNLVMCKASTSATKVCTYTIAGNETMSVKGANTVAASCSPVAVGDGSCGTATPTITASPNLVNPNDPSKNSSTLTFSATDNVNTSCILSDPTGPIPGQTYDATSCDLPGTPPYTLVVTPTTQTKYCFTCDGDTAMQACAVVNVVPGVTEF